MATASTVLRIAAATAGLCLLTACPNGRGLPPAESREPTTIAVMEPDVLFLAPGETGEVRLTITGIEGTHRYKILEAELPHTPTAPTQEDVTAEILEDNNETAFLRATIGPTVGPGIHLFPVRFKNTTSVGIAERTRELTVVVLPTDATPTAGRVVAMSTGDTHSLAISEDGSVWAWGRNDYGQIGDGSFADRQIPVRVAGLSGTARAVAAGAQHSLAVMDDGSVWGWGDNSNGKVQFGRDFGSFPAALVPIRLVADTDFYGNAVDVAAGTEHSVLLNSGGQVHTWGANEKGQLGSVFPNLLAFRVSLPVPVRAIAADGDHTVVTAADGSAWGWGRSQEGQLGAGVNQPQQWTPIDIAFVPGVLGAGLGKDHTLLVLDDDSVGGLGDNSWSQLGDGSLQSPIAQPVRPPHLLAVGATDGGWLHSLALQSDGRVFAWGSNGFGQASDSANTTSTSNLGQVLQLVPQQVMAVPPSNGIAAGGRHSLATTTACGSIYSWGDNSVAQLGDGAVRMVRARPEPVYGLGAEVAGCRKVLGLFSRGAKGAITAATTQGVAIDNADCSEPCVTSFVLDTVVTLTATPAAGSVFMGWSGNCSGTQPTIQVTMDRSRNCLAWFASPPVAQFTMTPNSYTPGDRVALDATTSADPDGRIETYQWDIGNDGTIDATGAIAAFRPNGTPPLSVRLIVTDSTGLTGESVQVLELGTPGGGQVTASFYYDPLEPLVGQQIHFGAFASSSPNGPISEYQWDFEDDGVFDATGAMVNHTYNAAGTFTVRLRVTDSAGQSAETTDTVTVSPG